MSSKLILNLLVLLITTQRHWIVSSQHNQIAKTTGEEISKASDDQRFPTDTKPLTPSPALAKNTQKSMIFPSFELSGAQGKNSVSEVARQAISSIQNTSKHIALWKNIAGSGRLSFKTEQTNSKVFEEEEEGKDYYLGPPYPPLWRRISSLNGNLSYSYESSFKNDEVSIQQSSFSGDGVKHRRRSRATPEGYKHDGSKDYIDYKVLPGTNVMWATENEKIEIVNLHNEYRRKQGASNMEHIVWDDEVAKEGYKRAEICVFYHDFYKKIGQNLAVTAKTLENFSWTYIIDLWMGEKVGWDFNKRKCNAKMCGHYTQVVWAKSSRIGCLKSFCPKIQNSYFSNALFIVCQYLPNGNYEDQNPHAFGPPCTECSNGLGWCTKDLCMDRIFCIKNPDQCQCPLTCENCGEMERYICMCSCTTGWDGNRCTNKCGNSNTQMCTNANGGYFKDQCTNPEYGEAVTGMCRAMCDKCVEGKPPPCSQAPALPPAEPPKPPSGSGSVPTEPGAPEEPLGPGFEKPQIPIIPPTTTVAQPSTVNSKDKKKNNKTIIIVVVVCAVFLAIALGAIVYMYYRQVKKRWSNRAPRRFSRVS